MGSLTKDYTDQKTSGRVYTPSALVARILDAAGYAGSGIVGARILDPACGDGQFLTEVVSRIIAEAPHADLPGVLLNVHGWDTDEEAVALCRTRLDGLAAPYGLAVDWNVRVRNSLDAYAGDDLFSQRQEPFQFIVGNPPYVRIQHLSEADRMLVQSRFRFCASGSTDLYIAFFELALSLLTPGGIVAFITPNTYFHTATGRALRHHLASNGLLRSVVNFGHRQVFPDATTYAAITVASDRPAKSVAYTDASNEKERSLEVDAVQLARQDVWRFEEDGKELDPERFRPLREIARIHVGLATLADPVFIVQDASPGGDGASDRVSVQTKRFGTVEIERGLLRPVIKGSKVKSGMPCYQGAFIIFPYETLSGRPSLIPENKLAELYPLGYSYLVQARSLLDRRDNGRPNAAGWYAFGRTQALETSFGEKIICPPMAKSPTFVVCRMADSTVYSGYFVKYEGNMEALAGQLNSDRMHAYVQSGGRDYMGGWKGYSKSSFQDFPIDITEL